MGTRHDEETEKEMKANMAVRHTPEPLHHHKNNGSFYPNCKRCALNAAAPDLLTASELALKMAATLMDELSGKKATDWKIVNDAAVALERAINKAKGRA